MIKNYFYLFFVFVCLSATHVGYSQTKAASTVEDQIKGLTVHPNPVSNGKVYITTSNNLVKDIEIFDVLGKKIYASTLFGKELNISKLTSGIYIIKIKENSIIATRKLVVR
jgi:hypothetical protein